VAAVRLPERVQAITEALYERNLNLAHSTNDDDRRILARMIAEQTRFELGEEWGWKSNHGVTVSPAKDAIAKRIGPLRLNERQPLLMWDLFNGTTRKPNQFPLSETEHIEQFFIPVEPVNHLGVTPQLPPKEDLPPVGKPPVPGNLPNSSSIVLDLGPVLAPLKAEIAALKLRIEAANERIEELENAPSVQAPEAPKLPKRIALRSLANGKLLCVDFDKGAEGLVYANREGRGSWETFEFIVVE